MVAQWELRAGTLEWQRQGEVAGSGRHRAGGGVRQVRLKGLDVAFNLKSYENQAKLSFWLGALGCLAMVGVAGILMRNYRAGFYVAYSAKSLFLPVFALGMLTGLVAATVGFFVALNSAGQRRNTRSRLSWQAFFLNAFVLTVLLSLGVFFYFARSAQG